MELNAARRYQSPGEYLSDLKKAKRSLTAKDDPALEEGADKTVMIVDSNPELQDVFRNGLKKVGYRVLVLSDAERAISRCDTNDHVADCVVFGCHSLGQSGLDAFNPVLRTRHDKRDPSDSVSHRKAIALGTKRRSWRQTCRCENAA